MKTYFPLILTLLLLTGCSTTNSGWQKPDLTKISLGMTKEQVVAKLGKPDSVASQGPSVILEYGHDRFMDGKTEPVEWFFVRLVNDRVESFGHKGDFGTTQLPQIRQQIEIIKRDQ